VFKWKEIEKNVGQKLHWGIFGRIDGMNKKLSGQYFKTFFVTIPIPVK
jgi:hypothetical protein